MHSRTTGQAEKIVKSSGLIRLAAEKVEEALVLLGCPPKMLKKSIGLRLKKALGF